MRISTRSSRDLTNAVVVGLGSIGQRHARVLRELGHGVATVSRRGGGDYTSIAGADRRCPSGICCHRDGNMRSMPNRFVSWPRLISADPFWWKSRCSRMPAPAPDYPFASLVVGYNLRFHPVMTAFAERLGGRQCNHASRPMSGRIIRDWRPGRDHRTTASATQQAGGGVLRDLSHELDYLLWLFGPWQRVAALGGSSGARDKSRSTITSTSCSK